MIADPAVNQPQSVSSDAGLDVPPEPVALRHAMHQAVLAGHDWDVAFGGGLAVGAVLWDHWEGDLVGAGMDRAGFDTIVVGYRRELWFWFQGERTWRQAVEGLAGRVHRRLPSP